MRTAETVLEVIRERGTRGRPLEDLYRQLFNPQLYLRAYGRLARNRGATTPGSTDETVDGMSLAKIHQIIEALRFERYRWTPVRRTYLPKPNGKQRPLGIPTWSDKLLQEVLRSILEAYYEPQFSDRSHGFRPGRGCHTALGAIYHRWVGTKWFLEGDIKGCFDNIDHQVLLATLRKTLHDHRFVRLIEALLQAGYLEDWRYHATHSGTPQGGVVSPLLANLFLHYAFDVWMRRNFPSVPFERYADDALVHCRSERQAQAVLEAIRGRFAQCGLELHPMKTRIVYCKDDDRRREHEHVTFDFLGYTFQPRRAKNRWGKFFVSFLPAMSTKAAKAVRATIRGWRMASTRNNQRLEDLARLVNPSVRGWMNYFGRFYRSKCVQVLRHLNEALAAWARRKYKRFRRRERASMHWLGRIAQRDTKLFVLWQLGVKPEAGS